MPDPDATLLHYDTDGAVALIAFDNPPVNAASHGLRAALAAALDRVEADREIRAVALYGRGRSFVAGADIREFGQPPRAPMLPALCNRIEAMDKPVVAVVHGVALGGGFELALAAHARVALPGTTLGFPEVGLGIIPGAGGTQRAPRLAGMGPALDLIVTGRRIGAEEALALGLIDRIETGAPGDVARAAAAALITGEQRHRRTGAITLAVDAEALAAARETTARRTPHLMAPMKAIDAVAAAQHPIAEGLATERALFAECLASPQRAGLVHAFFAERAVTKIPEAGATPREIARIGVIGAGTMGSGIATAALLAGFEVRLNERDAATLDRGVKVIEKNLAGAVKRGKISAEAMAAILAGKLRPTPDLAGFADVDLVIEAAFEDMAVKRDLFARLDAVCRPGAVLASNTSYLDIDAIAAETGRAGNVLGLHFFSPAHVMRLLEVVVGARTTPEVVATGFGLARRLNKVAVRAGVCDGFIGNRILAHYKKAADYLVADGADPAQVDGALESFGFAMGPFKVSDLAGGDIGWATRKRLAPSRPAAERYVEIADRLCERGWFGRKSGRGYYDYSGDVPVPNPELDAIIAAERARAGIKPRAFADHEIVDRYMTAMIAEAARVVEDGIALRPIDVDAVFLFGYGFPRFRGGPLHYADGLGAAILVRRIEDYAREDPHYWRVPKLLRKMAADGTSFADLNTRS